jgi:hypothetical protein
MPELIVAGRKAALIPVHHLNRAGFKDSGGVLVLNADGSVGPPIAVKVTRDSACRRRKPKQRSDDGRGYAEKHSPIVGAHLTHLTCGEIVGAGAAQ